MALCLGLDIVAVGLCWVPVALSPPPQLACKRRKVILGYLQRGGLLLTDLAKQEKGLVE